MESNQLFGVYGFVGGARRKVVHDRVRRARPFGLVPNQVLISSGLRVGSSRWVVQKRGASECEELE